MDFDWSFLFFLAWDLSSSSYTSFRATCPGKILTYIVLGRGWDFVPRKIVSC